MSVWNNKTKTILVQSLKLFGRIWKLKHDLLKDKILQIRNQSIEKYDSVVWKEYLASVK